MTSINLNQACTIIDAAIQEGRQHNLEPLSVAVLDSGGHLVAFKREDGASYLRVEIAFGKAWGALGMGFDSREIYERAEKYPTFITSLTATSQGRIIPSPGGVLIFDGEQLIGAIGISGDTGASDELCAVAGIKATEFSPTRPNNR